MNQNKQHRQSGHSLYFFMCWLIQQETEVFVRDSTIHNVVIIMVWVVGPLKRDLSHGDSISLSTYHLTIHHLYISFTYLSIFHQNLIDLIYPWLFYRLTFLMTMFLKLSPLSFSFPLSYSHSLYIISFLLIISFIFSLSLYYLYTLQLCHEFIMLWFSVSKSYCSLPISISFTI